MFSVLRIPGHSRSSSTKRNDMTAETFLNDGKLQFGYSIVPAA